MFIILLQLPIPGNLDKNKLLDAINNKDVDGLNSKNIGMLAKNDIKPNLLYMYFKRMFITIKMEKY